MKKLIAGALLAVVAWMIGTQIDLWYAKWIGLIVGFISGLIFEDWSVTKRVAKEKWCEFRCRTWDIEGALMCALFILVSLAGMSLWFALCYKGVFISESESQDLTGLSALITALSITVFTIGVFVGGLSSLIFIINIGLTGSCYPRKQRESLGYGMKTWGILNPISLAVLALYGTVRYVIPFIFKFWLSVIRGIFRIPSMLWRFSRFLFYTLLTLIAREKALTFAICVTTGAGTGMLLGKTLVCGVIAALSSSGLIFVSDKTRDWAENRLQSLKATA
jgi:hypothetical protein